MNPLCLENTQSSLLIPEKFLDVFMEKTKGRKVSKEDYFVSLLNRYRCLVLWKVYPKSSRAKTRYQDLGQNLVKPAYARMGWVSFQSRLDRVWNSCRRAWYNPHGPFHLVFNLGSRRMGHNP